MFYSKNHAVDNKKRHGFVKKKKTKYMNIKKGILTKNTFFKNLNL
jgi:hypothetical protein